MNKHLIIISVFLFISAPSYSADINEYYGVGLCQKPGFQCITVKNGQSWEKMFPEEKERDLIQRLNRTDTALYQGRKIVIPDKPTNLTLFDISPFPLKIKTDEKIIIVNQNLLAWGAYNPKGDLVYWGPISSGKDYCPDVGGSCRTITGIFYIFDKQGEDCESNIFPVGRGGSHMPYCMFFHKGYALHGSQEVHGHRDSHGCVRIFTKDAKWLNHNFVDVVHGKWDLGTKVVVEKLQ